MSSSAPPLLTPGTLVAPGYEVLAHLSRAKAFDVYDVWSSQRLCRCIAKTVRPDRVGVRGPARRLVTEGRLLRRLTHPHVVRAYETLWAGRPSRPVVVLETLGGHTLSYLIDEHDRLAPADGALLGAHLASALIHLHAHGYLHRDVKPSNIVCGSGRARLIDLGLARRPGRSHTRDGTREYMAPEQVVGAPLTAATDVWGLGVVLFETLTGRLPFGDHPALDDEDQDQECFPQMEGRAPPVAEERELPTRLAALVDACLAPEPAARPTMRDLFDGCAGSADLRTARAAPQPGGAPASRR